MDSAQPQEVASQKIAAMLLELAEEGKVYAIACSPGKVKDILVFLPSKVGAYWLVRGIPIGDYPKRERGDATWKQVDKGLAPSFVPDPTVPPVPKPEGMSIVKWLGDVPMVWFASARRYSQGG